MKWGLWLAIAVIAFLWFNHAKKQRLRNRDGHAAAKRASTSASSGTAPQAAPAEAPSIEHVVACAHCGLHVPLSDAVVTLEGTRFCSEAHRRLHPAA